MRTQQTTACALSRHQELLCGHVSFLMVTTAVATQLKLICHLLHREVPFLVFEAGVGGHAAILQVSAWWPPLAVWTVTCRAAVACSHDSS